MNSLRLVFGWLFLTALTAAGTYYAMDEVDQRVGLARFNLHEKLGITRYAAAPTPKPIPVTPTPTPTPIKPADYPDPSTGIIPPHIPGGDGPPPPILRPGPETPAVITPSIPARYPTPSSPVPGYPTPSIPSVPSIPSRPTPSYPTPSPTPASAPIIRPKDFNEVNDRLIDVRSRADASAGHWAGIEASLRSMNQPLRPQIKAALGSLKQNVATADQALRAGDTASARHYVEQAEKQLDILRQYDE
jgi:hypothetical protein